MVGKKVWTFICLVLFLAGLAGCGGSATRSSKSASSPATVAPEHVARPELARDRAPAADQAAPSAAPGSPSGGAEVSAREPAPVEERPGLGTEWGETRTSRVHDVSFVRESSRPFATATLNYNDERGVDALVSRARRTSLRDIPAAGGAVTVTIVDDSGDPLEAVRAGGRTFVIGHAGQRYSIVLTNHTSHRFEAVATVDGLDVVNGREGSFDNRGYVLLPFATLEIDGFRQSTSTVAAFRFASVADSYAGKTGRARNVGVIGVAFFTERGDSFVPERELRTRETASPFPADPRFAPPPPR